MGKKRQKKQYVNETHCLNCNAVLHGNYCAQCGQKAFLHKENFFHLAYEFTADYFHFDGKFFKTLKSLFTSPGKITRLYIEGKRKTYLNPIQMYLFVSAVFFIFFAKTVHNSDRNHEPINFKELARNYDSIAKERELIFRDRAYLRNVGLNISELGFCINNKVFYNKQYDSIEASLPKSKRENWLARKFHKKLLNINEATLNPSDISNKIYPAAITKSLPKAFFLLLPVFALILWLFFRKYPYADHIIFSLHFHVIIFVFLGIMVFLPELYNNEAIDAILARVILVAVALYLYISMKVAYRNNYLQTTLKFAGIVVLYFLVLFLTLLGVLLASVFLA